MTPVFADRLFYVALLNRRDEHHTTALNWATHERPTVVTTEFVLLEVANFFRQPPDRGKFAAFVRRIEDNPATNIVRCGSTWFQRGLDRFASRLDKEWSLTDCISFAVMGDRGLTQALTDDHHIVQAGFSVLF